LDLAQTCRCRQAGGWLLGLFQRRRHLNLKPRAMIPELGRSSDPGSGTGVVAPTVALRAISAKLPVEVELVQLVPLVGKKKSTSHAPVGAVQIKPECLLAC